MVRSGGRDGGTGEVEVDAAAVLGRSNLTENGKLFFPPLLNSSLVMVRFDRLRFFCRVLRDQFPLEALVSPCNLHVLC